MGELKKHSHTGSSRGWTGPEDRLGPGCTQPVPGVWVTSGRAAVVEAPEALALIDPGDEPWEPVARDLARISSETGKRYGWIAVTHAHPDHVANLGEARALAPEARLVAHPGGPLTPDLPVSGAARLPWAHAEATPGHSPWGDDLSFWVPASGVLFSGDLVQPKGETWAQAFYPSPYPFFTDPTPYLESLDRLAALPVEVLVTGHREVRWGNQARRWVNLTARAIRRVGEAVEGWNGPRDLARAAPILFREMCLERGISPEVTDQRLAEGFERFDLPAIRWFWHRRFGPDAL